MKLDFLFKLIKNKTKQKAIAIFVMLGFFSLPMDASVCFVGELRDVFVTEKAVVTKHEYTKTIKKEFPVSDKGTTKLNNKYGKIEVKTWEKNRVKIDINIIVKTSSETEAQEVFDRINIEFDNGDDFVSAATSIESKKSNWWSWSDNDIEFQIDYVVTMPITGSLDLTNKYGDAEIADIQGDADIDVKYGSFTLVGVGNALEVNLGYGSGVIYRAKNISGEVSYSKFRIKEAEDIDLSTKYSKVNVEMAKDVEIESRYDNYDVGKTRDFKCEARYGDMVISTANNVVCNSRYTEYKIEKVTGNIDLNLEYGGATVEQIANGFSKVILVGKYTDYLLSIEAGTSYELDANAQYAGIRYPSNMTVEYEKEKGAYHEVRGYAGTGNSRSVIKANLSYGALKLRNN